MNEINFNPCPLCGREVIAPSLLDRHFFEQSIESGFLSSLDVSCVHCRLRLTVFSGEVPVESCIFESVVRVLAERWNMLSSK